MILVYITNKDKKEAEKIANRLLKNKLIACANIFPIKSIYTWKGKLQNCREVALIAKTQNKNFEKIKKEVKKTHSYECPCIIKISASANKEYENWIKNSVE